LKSATVNENQTEINKSVSWLATFFLTCWLNMVMFFLTSALIGGTAQNGKLENGKFYVGEHSRYTEVSKTMYEFSSTHFFFTIITFVPTLLAVLISRKKMPNSFFRGISRRQLSFAIGIPLFWLIVFILIRSTSA
jgi:hypothetical protein